MDKFCGISGGFVELWMRFVGDNMDEMEAIFGAQSERKIEEEAIEP